MDRAVAGNCWYRPACKFRLTLQLVEALEGAELGEIYSRA